MSRRVTVCVRANTSSTPSFIPVRNQQGHLGLALELHSSPEMDSSGGQNQIPICKGRVEREGVSAGGTWERSPLGEPAASDSFAICL